jgi:SAM-dependent methyltransferase
MDRDTVAVYEARATDWRDRRPVRFPDLAKALGREARRGGVRLDVGCGAGGHLPHLGAPVVALDAAFAMAALARDAFPPAWPLQADLEALPFRQGSIAGSWARASYLHVRRVRLPWSLMELHRALEVDAPAAFTFRYGTTEGEIADDEFAGRFFAEWEPEPLLDVLTGAGFAVDSALAAGLVTRDRDPVHALVEHGVGMTDLCKRATVRADDLSAQEYQEGSGRLERLVRWLQPRAVCFVGLAGWRAAIDRRAVAGEQPDGFAGVPAYVMPNPSGLNARATPDVLAEHLRAALALADR